MASQMQQQPVPLDFNHLGGANQNNYDNNNNNYNNTNAMNGYPRGSYLNDSNNNYNPNFANQTQRMNNFGESNFGNNNQNMNNTLNNNNYNINTLYRAPNYNENNNQQNNNMEQNINRGMNEYVKKELSSHEINPIYSATPQQFRREEQERKKMLLNNIQSQINLTKRTKLEELRKRQEEDAQYLKDMVVCFPFGRGGGGAPIRDKSGNIVTNRRALISDPKYNLTSINVDDDYYDVWDKEKRIGRFYRNASQYELGSNNNLNRNQPLSNTGMNFNNNQGGYNQAFQQENVGRPYSTNPRLMNNNNNYNYNNNFNYNNGQNMGNNYGQQQGNNFQNKQQFFNTMQRPNVQNISLTYDNFEVMDRDQVRQIKENYRQDLINQIEENKLKKELEKKGKELEEAREEERLRKERDELEQRELEERNRNQQLRNRVRNENNLLIIEKNNRIKNNNNNNSSNNNNQSEFNNVRTINRTVRINEVNENNNNVIDQEAIDKINQKEMESKMQLNNEILKLREQMKDQQNDLFNQIAFLKQETQSANQQRFQALKEIEKLKDELSKQRADENLRRKYVYDVVVNDANSTNNVIQETHLPGQEKPEIVLPVKSENLYYDEKIRHPNRIIPVPKLTELYEHGVKTDSKFIDIDTHNIFNGLELYEPNDKLVDSQDEDYKINNRGIEIEGDYGTLRNYNDNNILKTSDVLLPNTSDLNKNTVNISINNKNVKSFKNIKNVETNKDGRTENININLETEDDGQFEVNRIYNKNLERLRYLNGLDVSDSKKDRNLISNNIAEKDNFDEFIRKLNRPAPISSKKEKDDDEFEIEISRLPK